MDPLTGIVIYSLHSPHVRGSVTFFPSRHDEESKSAEDFLLLSGQPHTGNKRIPQDEDFYIHDHNMMFRYEGNYDWHERPSRKSPTWIFSEANLRYEDEGEPIHKVIGYGNAIVSELVTISVERRDGDQLRHIADLAAAEMLHERELEDNKDLRENVEMYTERLATSDERLKTLAAQAAQYRQLRVAHKKRQAAPQHRSAAGHPPQPSPRATGPATPTRRSNSPGPRKPCR